MAYWWVNQGKTYKEEKEGSYLWAPKVGSTGSTPFHWDTMYNVKEGDVIFSYANGYLRAYSTVTDESKDCMNPFENTAQNEWERNGNKIGLILNELKNPIPLKAINTKLLTVLQNKYAPINSVGGVNQGYLYSINDKSGVLLITFIESSNSINVYKNFEKNIESSNLNETTKETIVQSRIGQGQFRKNLIHLWNGKCSVTSSNLTEILIASHCKPWKYSNNRERLDPNNGLLLSPTYDKLFDKGYISFDNKGKIILSDELSNDNIVYLTVDSNAVLTFIPNNDQIEYLAFHRDNIFI